MITFFKKGGRGQEKTSFFVFLIGGAQSFCVPISKVTKFVKYFNKQTFKLDFFTSKAWFTVVQVLPLNESLPPNCEQTFFGSQWKTTKKSRTWFPWRFAGWWSSAQANKKNKIKKRKGDMTCTILLFGNTFFFFFFFS